jgi:hypothetical protein
MDTWNIQAYYHAFGCISYMDISYVYSLFLKEHMPALTESDARQSRQTCRQTGNRMPA